VVGKNYILVHPSHDVRQDYNKSEFNLE